MRPLTLCPLPPCLAGCISLIFFLCSAPLLAHFYCSLLFLQSNLTVHAHWLMTQSRFQLDLEALLEMASLFHLPPRHFHIFLCHSLNLANQKDCHNAAGQEFSHFPWLSINERKYRLKASLASMAVDVLTGRCPAHPWLQSPLRTASDSDAWHFSLSLEENPSTVISEKAHFFRVTKVDFVLHLEAFKTAC